MRGFPAGTALLAALEAREPSDVSMFESPHDSAPAAVEAAVRTVGSMNFGELCSIAVTAAESLVGPWVGAAAEAAAAAYRSAEARRPTKGGQKWTVTGGQKWTVTGGSKVDRC